MHATLQLSLDLSRYPKLNATQAGHIRHAHNLATQRDGDWDHMGSQESMQEWLDAYRYQLALMAYAVGAAHYHRLPLLRTRHKILLRRLIHKMLRREVWAYWFNTSLSGSRTDPGRTELRVPWADPVVRENIMYSGHLLLMTSLYAMLFDDNEFEKPESLQFVWNPIFFGFGPETFKYDNRSLQDAILKEMERNGWVGVCCEPNTVFVVCNQFPMIAMRYNDARDGTNVVDGVLQKYKAAWDKKGMVSDNGLYADWWFVRQDQVVRGSDVGLSAWANAFMYTWNSSLIDSLHEKQAPGFITSIDGQIRLQHQIIANEFRTTKAKDNGMHSDAEILAKAKAKHLPLTSAFLTEPTLGYVVMWLSEVGKTAELQGLLTYADERLNPTWEKGGLFYPRNDTPVDDAGDWTHMDPFTGNAAIMYARLNVPSGQKKMWEKPWTRDTHKAQPWVDGLDLATGVDCLRGTWDDENAAVILTLKTWDDTNLEIEFTVKNLAAGTWAIYSHNELTRQEIVHDGGQVTVSASVGVAEVDIVLQKS